MKNVLAPSKLELLNLLRQLMPWYLKRDVSKFGKGVLYNWELIEQM